MYYMLLYEECIDRSVEFEIDLTPEEKLRKALEFIAEAKSRGDSVTYDNFKTITQYSTQYAESGCSYDDDNHYYHLDPERRRIF